MYTKNPQIRISLLNYSHFFINMSARFCTNCVNSLVKKSFFNIVFLVKVIKIFVTQVLIFGSSPHCAGKCMEKLYAVYIAEACQSLWKKNRSLNYQLISNSVIQIHSFCLVRYYARIALIVLVLMVGKADGQDFFLPKTIGFDFFCSVTSF